MNKIRKKHLILLLLGSSLLSLNILVGKIITLKCDAIDFLKGVGVGIMLLTLFFMAKDPSIKIS